jgi:glycosyltransferase involved in cell wall biosynthesis
VGVGEDGLACVVMSIRTEPGLAAAVRSLREQDTPPAEIVVVNTGGGGARAALDAAGLPDVALVDEEAPAHPGRARNLGIRATTARWVAFLSADCLAEPGWVAGRLRHHRAGAACVTTPVTNAHPGSAAATAAHLIAYWTRLPATPPDRRAHFGLSYERDLFRRFGLFREDLRVGEDDELNERIGHAAPPVWAPEVRTAHRHPTTVRGLVADQAGRGRRTATVLGATTGRDVRRDLARGAARNAVAGARAGLRGQLGGRAQAVPALPLLAVAAAARASGALTAPRPPAPPSAAPRRTRLLALVAFRDEMRFLPGLVANLGPQVDGIVALDDGSTDGSREYMHRRPEVVEVLEHGPRPEGEPWDVAAQIRALTEAGWRHGADWLLGVDADERLERGFRDRAEALFDVVGVDEPAFYLRIRELWDGPDHFRADGLFGRKRRSSLYRADPEHHRFDERRLHPHWASLDARPGGEYPQTDLVVYHLRMLHRSDRERRRARYERIDADNAFQPEGYAYMTDETGLRLERVTPGREPLPPELPPELL